MTIELRLTDVDPPTAEPARTIYRDIANLPDPTTLGITIRYFNYNDAGLYMQITGSATGYTFTPINLGLLASGANIYKNLDNFASRAKPTVAQLPNGEMSENITLTLKGYTDSGYTNLKWTFNRVVTVIWINSTDAAFTVDELDNFDDGTVQGWAAAAEYHVESGYPTLAVATNYVLSTPYSLKMRQLNGATGETRSRLYKSFTTPNKDKVYAIFDCRVTRGHYGARLKYVNFQRDSTALVFLGKPYDDVGADNFVADKWFRIVVPLPKNTTLELRVIIDEYTDTYPYSAYWQDLYLDDFKIISKS